MKTNRLTFALLSLIALLLPAAAHAEGNRVTKDFKIKAFDAVRAQQGINIVFTQAANPGIARVEADSETAPYLVVRVENKTLVAKFDFPSGYRGHHKNRKTTVRVSSPEIQSVNVSSAAGFKATNNISCSDNMRINASSSGDVNLQGLKCTSVSINASSAADVRITSLMGSGTVNASSSCDVRIDDVVGSLSVTASSAGDVKVLKMDGDDLRVNSSSGADAKLSSVKVQTLSSVASSGADIDLVSVNASTVSANASSGAEITISGKAGNISVSTSSGGKINSKGLDTKIMTSVASSPVTSSSKESKTKIKVTKDKSKQSKTSSRKEQDNRSFREP